MHIKLSILFGLFIILVMLLSFTNTVHAATQTGVGNIDVSAVVSGPPPSTAPTIDSPTQGSNLDTRISTVSGGCVAGLVVRLFINNVNAGSAVCQPDGTWSLQATLFENRNDLVARQYDVLDQSSPPSETITVYYLPPSATPTIPDATNTPPAVGYQLVINYQYTVKSVFPDQTFALPVSFYGGVAPYAVSIDWGDGTNDIYSRPNTSEFVATHTYKSAGYKQPSVRVTDSTRDTAFLQFVVLVNGKLNPIFGQLLSKELAILPIGWRLGVVAVASVFSVGAGVVLERQFLVKRRTRIQKPK
jgi:hypothetical protein